MRDKFAIMERLQKARALSRRISRMNEEEYDEEYGKNGFNHKELRNMIAAYEDALRWVLIMSGEDNIYDLAKWINKQMRRIVRIKANKPSTIIFNTGDFA